ncbi:hypothetical protein [Bacteroides thetaiotaomicron]|uniref:hypothetical protein n=1 Tax=Bacteroides thetaiotaomicron TaxID=818 RepID=UPI002166521F|nr:hypothetical protein [Bacteroides thetaiotaomicron]MCS2290643.1 hypothetical protein [Bacteroides thetaiotaomicron]MCS2293159.1 hypothetical protein [Bacteroides thetaiotaomicron]
MNAIRLGVPGASSGSARPYIDPDLLKHVKMAISTWGKSNDDPDRAILKDLTPNGNDMRLLNFGFAENSGYGLYSTDFTKWTKRQINDLEVSPNKISVSNKDSETALVIWLDVNKNRYVIPSYKIKVSKLTKTITYYYIDEANPSIRSTFSINKEGTYILPISRNDLYNGEENTNIGFGIFPHESFTIEQLPDFEGWLCTDGVDDIIESVKPISEMLEGSNEITVVSIIHQISLRGISDIPLTNYIRESNIGYVRNELRVSLNKTGIYGYTCFNIQSPISSNSSVINNILGDKEDYRLGTYGKISNAKLSVQGFIDSSGAIIDTSQVAYAGGFIANKVLTTDEINQIIAYFNLDRPGQIIKPQLYCNIKKQGITNDNHAEFNDQLIDFVGGHNIQLNNIGWEGESGIGSYPVVLGINKTFRFGTQWEVSNSGAKMSCVDIVDISLYSLYYNVKNPEGGVITTEIPSFTIKVSGITDGSFGYLRYGYLAAPDAVAITEFRMTADGTYTLPKCYGGSEALDKSKSCYVGFSVEKTNVPGSLIIEVLPTIENALCLNGISDFGKATGLPILKDYTICALRKWLYGDSVTSTETGSIVSKSKVGNNGAFILEQTLNRNPSRSSTFSFGTINSLRSNDKLNEESFTYQTKYSYNGETIVSGSGVDGDSMWLGTIRDGDSRFSKLALRSLMLFPYSLSEFLLERQLKKYKAGTLYPDMIEFRPVIKSNIPYSSVSYSVNPGEYITEGSTVTITITLSNASDKLIGVSSNAISDISISGDNGVYEVTGKVTKSPQKISIVISSYLTMLNNDTLISNETLIKNE